MRHSLKYTIKILIFKYWICLYNRHLHKYFFNHMHIFFSSLLYHSKPGKLIWIGKIIAHLGVSGLRETFQLLDDPDCSKLGRQTWVLILIIMTEFLICIKFGWVAVMVLVRLVGDV